MQMSLTKLLNIYNDADMFKKAGNETNLYN